METVGYIPDEVKKDGKKPDEVKKDDATPKKKTGTKPVKNKEKRRNVRECKL